MGQIFDQSQNETNFRLEPNFSTEWSMAPIGLIVAFLPKKRKYCTIDPNVSVIDD